MSSRTRSKRGRGLSGAASTNLRVRKRPIRWFVNDDTEEAYNSFASRKIELGKSVDLDALSNLGIEELFQAVGWVPMLHIDNPCYPKLVKHFYCNLTTHNMADELRIRSLVKGIAIDFGISELATIVGISPAGSLEYLGARATAQKDFDASIREEIFSTIMIAHTPGVYRIKESALRPTPRIVSRIIQHNILPRHGNRDDMRTFQIYLTYCIMIGKQVNLPYIIMRYMSDQQSRPISCLPFGKLLGQVFHHFGVDVTDETTAPYESPISALTLSQMQIGRDGAHGAVAHPPPPPPPPLPMPMTDNPQDGEGSSSGQYVTHAEFQSFTQRFEARFEERMDILEGHLHTLTTNHATLSRNQQTLQRQNDDFIANIHLIFKRIDEMDRSSTPSPPPPQ